VPAPSGNPSLLFGANAPCSRAALIDVVLSRDRPLGEGEAAFLSLVMQAANSEPIDDMSTEPTASLPDQLLESFIVRYGAPHIRNLSFFLDSFTYI
jgi:hypothetical protein